MIAQRAGRSVSVISLRMSRSVCSSHILFSLQTMLFESGNQCKTGMAWDGWWKEKNQTKEEMLRFVA